MDRRALEDADAFKCRKASETERTRRETVSEDADACGHGQRVKTRMTEEKILLTFWEEK